MKGKKWLFAAAVSGVALLGILVLAAPLFLPGSNKIDSHTNRQKNNTEKPRKKAPASQKPAIPAPSTPKNNDQGLAQETENSKNTPSPALQKAVNETPISIERLRNNYLGRIDDPLVQMDVIEEYLYFLQKNYADSADALFAELLNLAFPEDIAQQILSMAENMASYRSWYAKNRDYLNDMPKNRRKDLIWEKRTELFGDNAYALWAGELKADEIDSSLQAINDSEAAPLTEKFDQLDNALKRAYGPDAEAYKQVHREELLDRFISLESVQEDLRHMTAEERRSALKSIRKGMGMDPEAIGRLETLDKKRDDRWESGQAYMRERKEIVDKYSGEEEEKMLNMLRSEHFGEEAEIIKHEEGAGFFRFDRERQYGQF